MIRWARSTESLIEILCDNHKIPSQVLPVEDVEEDAGAFQPGKKQAENEQQVPVTKSHSAKSAPAASSKISLSSSHPKTPSGSTTSSATSATKTSEQTPVQPVLTINSSSSPSSSPSGSPSSSPTMSWHDFSSSPAVNKSTQSSASQEPEQPIHVTSGFSQSPMDSQTSQQSIQDVSAPMDEADDSKLCKFDCLHLKWSQDKWGSDNAENTHRPEERVRAGVLPQDVSNAGDPQVPAGRRDADG